MNLGKDEVLAGPFGCSSDCLARGSPGNLRDTFLFLSGRQAPDCVATNWRAEDRVVDSNRRLLPKSSDQFQLRIP